MSKLNEMAPGTHFHPILGDNQVDPSQVKRVVFCSGKYYYTLAKERENRNIQDIAIIRLEVRFHILDSWSLNLSAGLFSSELCIRIAGLGVRFLPKDRSHLRFFTPQALTPFPAEEIKKEVKKYPHASGNFSCFALS